MESGIIEVDEGKRFEIFVLMLFNNSLNDGNPISAYGGAFLYFVNRPFGMNKAGYAKLIAIKLCEILKKSKEQAVGIAKVVENIMPDDLNGINSVLVIVEKY